MVATEVRNLAQRSATAAKEIKLLIDTSVAKVNAGTQLVDEAGLTMDEVVSSVRHVTHIIAEISSASAEQTAGIEQINRAIVELDNTTQQNSALVEEIAAAAESLQDQARRQADVVSVFKTDDNTPVTAARLHNISEHPKAARQTNARQVIPLQISASAREK